MANGLRDEKSRFKDGRWKLTAFYRGMQPTSKHSLDSLWATHETILQEWLAEFGDHSPTPHVALAAFYTSRAWKHRGSGYADTVSQAAWKGWQNDIRLSKKALNLQLGISKKCPHWFNVMQEVALGESWSETEYEALFKEAITREPSYYFYYFSKANFYQSRWYGNRQQLMKFVDESVAASFAIEGYTLYSRIYWSAQREFGNDMFQPGNVDWAKMKAGFEFINKKYPHSIWNQNAYAYFACLARDKETTAQALTKIAGNINIGAWQSRQVFEYCKNWALSAG